MEQPTSLSNSTVTRIKIFIGSPGDVTPERQVAHAIINRVNKVVATNLGVILELLGWEDTLPGPGRPQAIINEDLKQCSFFIGLIWKRWGTPSGKESSGFLEEYKLANELREKGQMNDIWLFFKNIPDDIPRQESKQVAQVQDFQQEVYKEQNVFCKSFETTEEWGDLLYDNLIKYLLTRRNYDQASSQVSKLKSSSAPQSENSSIIFSLNRFRESVSSHDYTNISVFDLSRITMTVQATSYSQFPTSSQKLASNSDLINLYATRETIELNEHEKLYLAHTLLADSYFLDMGWYWLRDEITDPIGLLMSCLDSQRTSDLKEAALKILREVAPDEFTNQANKIFKIDDASLQSTIFDIIIDQPTANDGPLLVRNNEKLDKKKAWKALFQARYQINPDAAISMISKTLLADRNLPTPLVDLFSHASVITLRPLLQDEDELIVLATLKALKSTVPDTELRSFLENDNFDIAFEAFLELATRKQIEVLELDKLVLKRKQVNQAKSDQLSQKKGYSYPGYFSYNIHTIDEKVDLAKPHALEATIRYILYNQKNQEELESLLDWSYAGSVCYSTLVETYYPTYKDTLRTDISSRFERIKAAKKKEPAIQLGKLRLPLRSPIETDEFILGNFMINAITVLYQYASELDIPLAIGLLNNPNSGFSNKSVQRLAISIIQKYGSAREVSVVEQWVASSDYVVQKIAILSIFDHNNPADRLATMVHYLKEGELKFKRLVLTYALINKIELPIDELIDLLYQKQEGIRLLGLAYLVQISTTDQLETLLESYTTTDETNRYTLYYYNVVGWLDRILYSPSQFNKYYRNKLMEFLEESSWDWKSMWDD
ncbi:hypothetical protein GCM10028808_70790 [Spirosoma migulaei]